jgi:hypothetical protein
MHFSIARGEILASINFGSKETAMKITIRQLAEKTGLTKTSLRHKIRIGEIQGFKENGLWKVDDSMLEKSIEIRRPGRPVGLNPNMERVKYLRERMNQPKSETARELGISRQAVTAMYKKWKQYIEE